MKKYIKFIGVLLPIFALIVFTTGNDAIDEWSKSSGFWRIAAVLCFLASPVFVYLGISDKTKPKVISFGIALFALGFICIYLFSPQFR